MKESILRETIRKEIRKSLKEVDVTTGVERQTSRIEKNAGVKMLKRALAQGSPRQQAAGLLKVIDAISGGSTAVKNALVQLLKRTDLAADTAAPAEEPVTEGIFDFLKKKKKEAPKKKIKGNEPIGVDYDGNYIYAEAEMKGALANKQARLDKTQAFVQLKNVLATKPALQQVDYVIQLVNGLGLRDSAKKRLVMKLRKELS
jgi:hypothetical protein